MRKDYITRDSMLRRLYNDLGIDISDEYDELNDCI